MAFKYIRESGIRKLVKKKGKRCGKDFLHTLDTHIYKAVVRSCNVFNGHKQTLDSTIAEYSLGK